MVLLCWWISIQHLLNVNTIQYFTISTTGNAADFGDLTSTRRCTGGGCCSNAVRGLYCGGERSNSI